MEKLIFNLEQNNVPTALIYESTERGSVTTSQSIANVFGKNHHHVLRDIKNMACSEDFRLSNFGLMFNTRQLPNNAETKDAYYEVTKDGFSFLVMGYKGDKAAKFKEDYIKAFNQRDSLLKSDEYILTRAFSIMQQKTAQLEQEKMLLQEVISRKEQKIELQEVVIKKGAPKIKYHDEVLTSTCTYRITAIAKEMGFKSGQELNQLLHAYRVQYKVGKMWVLYSNYQGLGYTDTETIAFNMSNGDKGTNMQTVWTEKGRRFIHEIIKQKSNLQ